MTATAGITGSELPHALLACAQMASADAWTIEHGYASGMELMENAGAAVADAVLERCEGAKRVLVLCGPGNNGGDGYVAARILRESGLEVFAYAFGPPRKRTDAEKACSRFGGPIAAWETFEPRKSDILVDAVYGAGLSRALPDEVRTAFAKVREAGCAVFAVDLPSGVNGDSGADLGGALAADATVTFFRKKPGHLLHPGRLLCGDLVVADIGVRPGSFRKFPPSTFENGPDLWAGALPRSSSGVHKYSRGHVAVFSGARHSSGASRLSAQAAQRVGAGAVTIIGQPDALDIHAAHVTSIMLKRCTPEDAYDRLAELNGCRACVLGPGFGDLPSARRIALSLLHDTPRTGMRMVLDADGISAFAGSPPALFEAAQGTACPVVVLTPHEGEFRRLFPDLSQDAALSKVDKACAAARRANAVVVYKGPDTVIAAPDGRSAINGNATTSLATAGSGDVLAGLIAGLSAQGMPLWEAGCAAVWLHGEAGRSAGPLAIAEDLVQFAALALARFLD